MSREQFTDKFASLFAEHDWNEEKVKNMAALLYTELEKWQERRRTHDVVSKVQEEATESIVKEMQKMTKEIERLNKEIMGIKKDG